MRRYLALSCIGAFCFALVVPVGARDEKTDKKTKTELETFDEGFREFSKKQLQLEKAIVEIERELASRAGDKKKEAGPPPVERGPEHKVLESLVGTFDASVKFYFPDPTKPTTSKGVMTRTMILGGNYLQESFTGEFFGAKFSGLGIIGYDANKKHYVTTWCDSMSTSMSIMHGSYDADKKTFTSVGEEIEPASKKKMKQRDVLKIINADEQTFEMFRLLEGTEKEFKIMDLTYTRRKAEKK